MSPARAQATGRRLVATVLVLMASTSVMAVVVALSAGAPLGPLWWALPLLAALALSVAACLRCAVQAFEATAAAVLLLATCLAGLLSAHVVPGLGEQVEGVGGGGGMAWAYFLGIACVSSGAVLTRTWRTVPAVAGIIALGTATALLRSTSPLADTSGSSGTVDVLFLSGLGLAVLAAVRGVEDVSDRLRRARAAALRADDEAEELALAEAERSRWEAAVHDDVLTSLRAAAAVRTPQEQVAAAAAAGAALQGLTASPTTLVVSTERAAQSLESAARAAREGTVVDLHVLMGSLPGRVAEALAEATTELLRNTERHNGPDVRSRVQGHLSGDLVSVVVSDDGRGFDLQGVAPGRLGIRVSVVGRLRSVGGSAEVDSAPGRGVSVHLRWPR